MRQARKNKISFSQHSLVTIQSRTKDVRLRAQVQSRTKNAQPREK